MYLAHKYFKVANVPLVPEVGVPDELFEKDPKRVFGLIANLLSNEIRQERLKSLGLSNNAIMQVLKESTMNLNILRRLWKNLTVW